MIQTICYIVIFITEMLTAIFFFEIKFDRKSSVKRLLILASCFCSLSILINFSGDFTLNILVFFAINLIILLLCYNVKLSSCIFNISLMIFYMIITELIVLYTSSFAFNWQILPENNDPIALVTQTAISKLLYFIAMYLTAKFSQREKHTDKNSFSLLLCILPISSASLMVTTTYILLTYQMDTVYKNALIISTVLILLSNILVFYVYEHTMNTNRKYTIMLLEKQNQKNNEAYYKLLKEQNENAEILIHDIKKHLSSIRNISQEPNPSELICNYIDSIIGGFDKSKKIDYSKNKLLNLITYRYDQLCRQKGIDMQINIREAVLDFLPDCDITSLFDNLLENAMEAAEKSEEKCIDFSIYIRNENFVVIKISNSFNLEPKIIKGHLISSKKSSKFHGIGTRSIRHTVSKHNGDLNIKVDDKNKIFYVTVVFKLA